MNLNEYKKHCLETWIYTRYLYTTKEINDNTRALLGLIGETGEVAEVYKKYLRGDFIDIEKRLEQELGDVLYYIMIICDLFNLDVNKILELNIKKLKSGKERNKIKGDGDNR